MNHHLTRRIVGLTSLALLLALAIWVPIRAQAADKDSKPMNANEMKEHCQEMTKLRTQMTADMKAADADLSAQITRMNSAPAERKLDLMAAIVTSLVEQRSAMNLRWESMQLQMGPHMAEHMQMGQGSMSQCPMMAGMQANVDAKGRR